MWSSEATGYWLPDQAPWDMLLWLPKKTTAWDFLLWLLKKTTAWDYLLWLPKKTTAWDLLLWLPEKTTAWDLLLWLPEQATWDLLLWLPEQSTWDRFLWIWLPKNSTWVRLCRYSGYWSTVGDLLRLIPKPWCGLSKSAWWLNVVPAKEDWPFWVCKCRIFRFFFNLFQLCKQLIFLGLLIKLLKSNRLVVHCELTFSWKLVSKS